MGTAMRPMAAWGSGLWGRASGAYRDHAGDTSGATRPPRGIWSQQVPRRRRKAQGSRVGAQPRPGSSRIGCCQPAAPLWVSPTLLPNRHLWGDRRRPLQKPGVLTGPRRLEGWPCMSWHQRVASGLQGRELALGLRCSTQAGSPTLTAQPHLEHGPPVRRQLDIQLVARP